jgi:hypothetical protein
MTEKPAVLIIGGLGALTSSISCDICYYMSIECNS